MKARLQIVAMQPQWGPILEQSNIRLARRALGFVLFVDRTREREGASITARKKQTTAQYAISPLPPPAILRAAHVQNVTGRHNHFNAIKLQFSTLFTHM